VFGFTFFRAAAGQQSSGQRGTDNHFNFHNGSFGLFLKLQTRHLTKLK
jgi:hypothetical protein